MGIGRTLTLAGPENWTTTEVINLCESLSGVNKAKVTQVPIWVLQATRFLLSGFQWTKEAADRLAFTEIVRQDDISIDYPEKTYDLFGIQQTEIPTLEEYLKEYYTNIMKKLKEVGAESRQTDFYV